MKFQHNIKSLPRANVMTLRDFQSNHKLIQAWIEDPLTKKGHVDCKQRSLVKGLRQFRIINNVTQFWMMYPIQDQFYKDDSIEIYYREN